MNRGYRGSQLSMPDAGSQLLKYFTEVRELRAKLKSSRKLLSGDMGT